MRKKINQLQQIPSKKSAIFSENGQKEEDALGSWVLMCSNEECGLANFYGFNQTERERKGLGILIKIKEKGKREEIKLRIYFYYVYLR